MRLINSKAKLLIQENGLQGIYKQIELAGRTCYKSEDKITDSSSVDFVKRMITSGHTAMLEHGTVYLMKSINVWPQISFNRYYRNPYSKAITKDGVIYVTTNLRVLQENNWLDDLQFLCEPTEHHERRITLKFITNIGVTREGNRHRTFPQPPEFSVAEESTRYCNYSKDKFDNQITYCKPAWINDKELDDCHQAVMTNNVDDALLPILIYQNILTECENAYNRLIKLGWEPQQAREILPLATKSEIIYTAFVSDWKHWFDLRLFGATGKPHPNMLEIAEKAKKVLEENDLWYLIYKLNEN